MLIGPVFSREVTTSVRNLRLYLQRAVYVAALFGLVLTAWLILLGSQSVRSLSDLARFGSAVFGLLAPLQMAMAVAFAALLTTAAVAQEKDRRTLDLLLMTRMTNAELVLGKLLASSLSVFVLIIAAVPLLMLLTLLGGVSYGQVFRVVGVTLAAAAVAGSLGSTLALWREKTFQSLAMTALGLVLWVVGGEVLASGRLESEWLGAPAETWAIALSPLRAILAAIQPLRDTNPLFEWCGGAVNLFMLLSIAAAVLLNLWAILRMRVWNPSQELQPRLTDEQAEKLASQAAANPKEKTSKQVWDNPILWREVCTWAYGKKIVVVKAAYLVIFAICAVALVAMLDPETSSGSRYAASLPVMAKPLLPLMVLGLVLVNALAVTSLTNERDLRALDLLLVTDLSPKEIIYGKLLGTFYNSKEMILLPLALSGILWFTGELSTENIVFLTLAFLVMNCFVAMLGVHCGMTYAVSQTAVGVSLSTVLFLLLGIGVCMRMMMAFQNSFTYQLQAFIAFMVCGGAGMFYALGIRNPSRAIALASGVTPFATYIVITNYFQQSFGAAFLITVVTYVFITAAMLVPAVYEFDVATGRTTGQD
ncbi:ABC transporter permease subunit [Bythopirellula goksoeyrii]|uniref:ABC-2 family transporter protein n=1 Tax=Bythopirellula goksoeyrii TaxID=1400387 RepID=A0A5B9QF56_9BACT|nr:ABC transporter permease subunit [Bythopirellula goksoeyrii]QEG32943.1 ABC-2 family transporter protein [Bythopirellula goksoeyrii]